MMSAETKAQPLQVENEVGYPGPQRLQLWNWANLAAYGVNFVTTGISSAGFLGKTNPELAAKYQTLITPAGGAFSIWGLIFLGELIFAIAQMMPSLRSKRLVQAVCPWWVATCFFQSAWNFLFAFEFTMVAEIFIAGILVSLLGLLWAADGVRDSTLAEYWLLQAPFSLHAGWVLAATAVGFNVLMDSKKAEPSTLLATALTSVAVVFAVAALFAVAPSRPDGFISLVGAWATFWISQELGNPVKLLNKDRFNFHEWDAVTIAGVRMAAQILSLACLGLAILALALRLLRTQNAAPGKGASPEEGASVPPLAAGA